MTDYGSEYPLNTGAPQEDPESSSQQGAADFVPTASPLSFAPKLPTALQEAMPRQMSELILATVRAHDRRDRELVENYEQLMRITPPTPNRPWRDSCDLVDPIAFGEFLTLFATTRAARGQRPWWMFGAIDPADEEAAQRVEKGLSHRAYRDGFSAALYDADWVALRDKCAPMFIGWKERRKNIRQIRYRETDDPNPDNLITDPERQQGVDYEEVPYLEPAIDRAGLHFHVPDLADWYMMPPDANDIDDAMGVGHRERWTANQLRAAIAEYDLDSDGVDEALRLGPTGYAQNNEYVDAKREVSGTDHQSDADQRHLGIGLWEVYFWFGKFPLWSSDNGKIDIPEYLQQDEFLWIICPHHEICLRFGYSPFLMRPYTLHRMLREPNGQGGESVTTIVGPHQEEGTAWLRIGIDSANLRAVPMVKQLEENDREFGSWKVGPGRAILCKKTLQEVEAFTWDHAGASESAMILQDIRARAKETISGAGYGQLQQKVRKSAEIEAAVAGVSAKMNLIVQNLQDSGMVRAALIMLSHLGQFSGDDPYVVYSRTDGVAEVQPDDWGKAYDITPRGSGDDANPAMRVQKKEAIRQILLASPWFQLKIQGGDYRPDYHSLTECLIAMDEPNAKAILGEPPPPPEYLHVASQIMAQVYQAATGLPVDPGMFMQSPAMRLVMMALVQQSSPTNGNQPPPLAQAAQAVGQMSDQAMAQHAAGGGPMGSAAGGNAGNVKLSANYKDMDPQDQAALMKMAGLPGPGNPAQNGKGVVGNGA